MFGLYGKKFILTKFKLTRSHQGWFVIAEVMVAIVWAGGWVREREREVFGANGCSRGINNRSGGTGGHN